MTRAANIVDVQQAGCPRAIGAWRVGDALIDCGPATGVEELLRRLGDWTPQYLLLTHIHLDHAGAAGALARQFPELTIYVHERGARHLADPARLNESTRLVFGEDMDTLLGELEAVPEERIRTVAGGESLGPFSVAYTPGHASHHVAFLHESGRAFVGDVGGVRIEPEQLVVSHTPVPDVDIDAWEASIEGILAWHPTSLGLPHFGVVDDVEAHFELLLQHLHESAALARTADRQTFAARYEERLGDVDPKTRKAYHQVAHPDHSYAGLRRYWTKRESA